jgi:hypothetical protein
MKKIITTVLLAFNLFSYSQTEYEIIFLETSVDEFDVIGSDEYEKHNRTTQDITEKLLTEARSSAKSEPIDGDVFDAKNMIDGNMKTCWLSTESPKNDFVEIIIDLEENVAVNSAQLLNLYFVNGWRKNMQSWKDYSRIKKAYISINEMPYCEVTLEDTYKFQSMELDKFKVEKSKRYRFRIKILEVYKGAKYPNVAISDLQIIGKVK